MIKTLFNSSDDRSNIKTRRLRRWNSKEEAKAREDMKHTTKKRKKKQEQKRRMTTRKPKPNAHERKE
jgi:hypothetical protein